MHKTFDHSLRKHALATFLVNGATAKCMLAQAFLYELASPEGVWAFLYNLASYCRWRYRRVGEELVASALRVELSLFQQDQGW